MTKGWNYMSLISSSAQPDLKASTRRKRISILLALILAVPLSLVGAATANAYSCSTIPGSTLTYANPYIGTASSGSNYSCGVAGVKNHSGKDVFKGTASFQVLSVKGGAIIKRGSEPTCHGYYLVQTHSDGVEIGYAHLTLDDEMVHEDPTVSINQGVQIANSGNSGNCGDSDTNNGAGGIHLHVSAARNFEINATSPYNPWTSPLTTMFNSCTFLNTNGASIPGC